MRRVFTSVRKKGFRLGRLDQRLHFFDPVRLGLGDGGVWTVKEIQKTRCGRGLKVWNVFWGGFWGGSFLRGFFGGMWRGIRGGSLGCPVTVYHLCFWLEFLFIVVGRDYTNFGMLMFLGLRGGSFWGLLGVYGSVCIC